MESCIVNGIKRFGQWCTAAFLCSWFGKLCVRLCAWVAARYRGSLVCRFFTDGLSNEASWRNSLLYRILHLPVCLLEKIAVRASDACQYVAKNSVVWRLIDNWALLPSRVYGYIILCYALTETLLLWAVYGEVQLVKLFINGVLVVLALLLVLLNRSPKSLYKGSILLRAFGSFFYKSSGKPSRLFLEDKDIRVNSHIASVCLGIVLGVLGFLLPFTVFALLVGGLGVALLTLKDVRFGLFLTVFGAPILPTMALVGLSLLCLVSLLLRLATDKEFHLTHNGLTPYVVFYVLALVMGVVTSFTFMASAKIALVYLSFIAFYFVLVNTVTDRKIWRALTVTFIVSAVLVGLFGILQNFVGISSTASWVDAEMFTDIERRVYSTFDNPNVLGEFLVITIPVALALFWSAKRYGHKATYVLAVLILAACMIFTWSRGAWLGVMLAVVLFVLVMDKRFFLLGILGLFLLPLLLASDNPISARLMSIGDMGDSSTAYRVSIWLASLGIIRDFWLGGIGPGSDAFSMVYPKYAFSGANFALHAHNLFLQVWIELGIVGIVALVALVFATMRQGLGSLATRGRGRLMNTCMIALTAGLLGYLFQGMADNVWYNYKMVLIFWCVLGLITSGAGIAKREAAEARHF